MWKVIQLFSEEQNDKDKFIDWKPLNRFQNIYVSSIIELTESVNQAQQTILKNMERRKNNS